MGKGIIQSHIGSGKYTVEVQYDRSGVDEQIEKLEAVVERLDEKIDDSETSERRKLYLKAARASAQKRIDYLNNSFRVPQNDTVEAWCADLTTDLSGEIGLIEIARDRSKGINIQPGYEGGADYDSDRDGSLIPIMGMPPAMAYVNLGLLPGAQKWLPTYRYARIDSIDHQKNKCDLTFLTKQSDQQDLPINQTVEARGVPIDYMFCDSAAFSEGDEVIVKFEEYDFVKPKVIGFKDNPQPCATGIFIITAPSGDEAFAWDAVDNQLVVGKDTYENVLAQISPSGKRLEPGGQYGRDAYPWGYRASQRTSLSEITGLRSETEPRVVQHPVSAMRLLGIQPLAFGQEFSDRQKWKTGDTVILQTSLGSGTVSVVSVDSESGEFDVNYVAADADRAIDQTWTLTVYEGVDDDLEDYRYIYIEGNTLGAISDFEYFSVGRSCYPLTPDEVDYGEDAEWLKVIGFTYAVDGGNYVTDSGNTIAPVVIQWTGRSSAFVSPLASEFELLTGVNAPSGNAEMDRRTQLFYVPSFGWRWQSVALHPWLAVLHYGGYAIEQLIDTWADADYSGGNPEINSDLRVTSGRAENGDNVAVYDAFHLLKNNEHVNGLHLFFKCSPFHALTNIEMEILSATNSERASYGLGGLALNLALCWAAKRHTDDMAENYEYYKSVMGSMDEEHVGTDGTRVADRAYQAGYYDFWRMRLTPAGEILQYVEGDLSDFGGQYVVDGWMASPGHREIVIETALKIPEGETWLDTGVAHSIAEDGTHFFCQVFSYLSQERAGFSPMPASGAKKYMDDNFNWAGDGDASRLPQVYLI